MCAFGIRSFFYYVNREIHTLYRAPRHVSLLLRSMIVSVKVAHTSSAHTHFEHIDEAAVDSILISSVRGKSLPVLLNTLREVAPAHSIPVAALDLQECSVGDIR